MKTDPAGPVEGPPAKPSRHLPGLDGLRAIAVAAVVIYHVIPGALPGGGLGVDLFFVISGFLITGLLLREHERDGRIRLRSFWARRARRLVPALVVLVAVCCSAGLFVGGDVLVGIGRQVLGAATFSSNWLAIATDSSYFGTATPELFRNLWSLSVEEQFYLVWPFVVLLALRVLGPRMRGVVFLAIGIVSAAAMVLLYTPGVDPTRVYYGTDTHSFGLAFGAALAVFTQRMSQHPLEWPRWASRLAPIPGVLALAGIIAIAILLPAEVDLTFRGGLVAVAALTAVAIWGAIIPNSLLGRILDLAPLRWVGVRSYGIYLWHWPVLLVIAAEPSWQDTPATAWLTGPVTVVVSVGVAALSYRFLELPIRREGLRAWLGRVFGGGARRGMRIAAATVAGLVLAASIGGTALAISTAPNSGTAQGDIQAGAKALANSQHLPPPPPGAPGRKIVAVGDSVMLASAPELQASLPGIKINAVVSRQMNTLPGIVKSMLRSHTMRQTLVVGLGTNGYISESTLRHVRNLIGPSRRMIIINTQVPRVWEASVNHKLRDFADSYDNVTLADWHRAIAPHISLLAPDHIHAGPTGGRIYTKQVVGALKQLNDLPPYPPLAALQLVGLP